MVWNIDYLEDLQIVESTVSGRTTGAEILQAAAARIEFGQARGANKYLIDAMDLLAESSVTFDVLEAPAVLFFKKNMDRKSRIAVVAPRDPDSQWLSRFYEDASANRGWLVRVFDDRKAAIAWLQQSA